MRFKASTPRQSRANVALWVDHPATPRQQELVFDELSRAMRPTQADVLLGLLRAKRAVGKPLELPEILHVQIAQHSARFVELRRRGFVIDNELERASDGRTLSRYWLRHDPERDGQP